ncbi:Rieske 2Fe-2S domain-containing protein [Mycobacterium attenuatum]|uniref:Rieske 2Fe-2S domain-containing protein n=1 Tax=Mycobacterium attenuatum TaxID=2341086 RepID=UPI000F03F63C|nr:Rieske 2Fe-2S domain-containing protein [Mycobacterium attenuatum]
MEGTPMVPASTPARPLINALEQASVLDVPAQTIASKVRQLLGGGKLKQAISGTWLGHPAHPPLTDLVIGSFLSASVLDLLAPRAGERAARRLITMGIAASTLTAVTGFSDWADTELSDESVRRVGLVHSEANLLALMLYFSSLIARRRGARMRGALLAFAGAGVLGASGYLGGHMAYVRGVGVNQTAFDAGPQDWTAVGAGVELIDGQMLSAEANGTPVLLVWEGGNVYAIHDRCSHRGCVLSEGKLESHVITCSCHGSQFDVRDGTLLHGPATVSQPSLDAREVNGRIEVRRVTRG